MARKVGAHSITEAERNRLVELAALGLTQTEVGRLMGRHPSTIWRHGRFLGLSFGKPQRQPVRRDEQAELRRQRRQLEDELIRRFAEAGWSEGMAANELDLDCSTLWRHSLRLGVKWSVRGRSRKGDLVPGLTELAAVSNLVKGLVSRPWTDADGRTRPLRPEDILVVAPYNAQIG